MTLLPFLYALFTSPTPAPYVEPAHPASDVYTAQAEAIQKMAQLFPDVQVDVRWEPCGMENSFYEPWSHNLVLCTEMADQGRDVAVGVAAHEFAHAILDQRTATSTEEDADELSALLLVKFGDHDAVLGIVKWMRSLDMPQIDGDPHPGTAFRAWELACIDSGSRGEGPAECRDLYNGLRLRYNVRLGLSTP